MSSRDTFTVELHPGDDTRDALLRALHTATEDRYSIVGEMSAPDNELLLLARSNERGQLVTLSVRPSTWRGTRIHVLTVAPVRRAPEIGAYEEPASTPIAPPAPPAPPIAPEPATPEPVVPLFTHAPLRLEPSSRTVPDEPMAEEPDAEPEVEPQPEPEPEPVARYAMPVAVPDEFAEPVALTEWKQHHGRDEPLESEEEWAAEMRGYSSWRGRTKMLIGAAAALILFITLVVLATQSSDGTARGAAAFAGDTAVVAPADTADTTAFAPPPVKTSSLASVATPTAPTLPPAGARSLTESPPAVTQARRATTSGARSRTTAPRSRPVAQRGTERVNTESAGTIDPAGAFGAPSTPATTTAKRTEAPARSCASLMADNARDAIAVCQRAALLGNAEAQSQMGLAYERGDGVRRDFGEAVAWFRKAASQGHAWSENHLGWMYASGTGVERDDTQAVRWFRLAAEHGNAEGQYNLGFMYQRGRGVPKSSANAAEWYRRAAKQGNRSAIRALESLGG